MDVTLQGTEWTAEELKRVGYKVVDLIAEHLTTLPDRPVFRPVPPAFSEWFLQSSMPQAGESADSILQEFAERIEPYPMGNGHPRFYAWVNSPPTPVGIFADALAAAMDPSCAGGNHAAIYVEHAVLNWFRDLLGFPPASMGLLVSGGSMANLTGLAVARHVICERSGIAVRQAGLQRMERPLVLYIGAEGHGCIRKAAELLGIGGDYTRVVPSDSALRIRPDALEETVRADLQSGLRPFAVAASAGTVNTGAIDPVEEIAEVCGGHGLWLHIDAAYGGPALLSTDYGEQLKSALSLADSIALDPHKWLYVPVEAGLVMVKNGEAMRDAFSHVPPYLRTDGSLTGVGGPPWFSEYGFQQTRGFRALKIWMALKYHGIEGYRRLIDHDISLARHLASLIEAAPDMEMLAPQNLSIVCFRYAPPSLGGDDEQLNALNKRLLETLQLSGEAFLSSTLLHGRFALRACIVNHHARRQDIDFLVQLVREIGESVKLDA